MNPQISEGGPVVHGIGRQQKQKRRTNSPHMIVAGWLEPNLHPNDRRHSPSQQTASYFCYPMDDRGGALPDLLCRGSDAIHLRPRILSLT
jgi:hypothetical protein